MRKTRGLKDILTGKAVLLPQPLWFMKEVDRIWDKAILQAKKEFKVKRVKS